MPAAPLPSLQPPDLAVALDRAGWHPAAWREPRAHPRPNQLVAGEWKRR
jgi:hypothetical protein